MGTLTDSPLFTQRINVLLSDRNSENYYTSLLRMLVWSVYSHTSNPLPLVRPGDGSFLWQRYSTLAASVPRGNAEFAFPHYLSLVREHLNILENSYNPDPSASAEAKTATQVLQNAVGVLEHDILGAIREIRGSRAWRTPLLGKNKLDTILELDLFFSEKDSRDSLPSRTVRYVNFLLIPDRLSPEEGSLELAFRDILFPRLPPGLLESVEQATASLYIE